MTETGTRKTAGADEAFGASRKLGNPLHRQVFLVLRERIESQRYAAGEMLPSEEELVRLFGVSRTTVRNALAALEQAGFIERRQGVGTFVRDIGAAAPLHTAMSDLVSHIREISRSTDVRVIEFGYVRAPKHIQARFGCDGKDLFQRAVRIRSLKGQRPILHVTSYIPERLGRHFGAADMEKKPIYALLEETGVRLCAGEQRVTATLAEPTVAAHLKIDVGAPLLQIDRIHFDQDREPVEYIETFAVPAYFELRMTLEDADLGPPGP